MTDYTILKNLNCYSVYSDNYEGSYRYDGMEGLTTQMIQKSIWDDGINKENIPAISMTTFKNRICKDTANPTTLYALDFDDANTRINDVRELFKDHAYSFYTSYSHTPDHHKFRMILELDIQIMSNMESHIIFKIIDDRLREHGIIADKQCKDISRRFYLPAYNKAGKISDIDYNDGCQYQIADDFSREIVKLYEAEEKRKTASFLNFVTPNKKRKSKTFDVNKKIEKVKSEFLNNPSNKALGKLINGLKFWGVDDYEVRSWAIQNYNPTTGNLRSEVDGWMRCIGNVRKYNEK